MGFSPQIYNNKLDDDVSLQLYYQSNGRRCYVLSVSYELFPETYDVKDVFVRIYSVTLTTNGTFTYQDTYEVINTEPLQTRVRCIETGKVYFSALYASRCTGVSASGISNCCRKKAKTSGGFHWEFAE